MMKAKLIFFLKLFLISTLFFGVLTTLVDIFYSNDIVVESQIFKSLIFGSVTALVLGSFQLLRMNKIGLKTKDSKDFNLKQTATIESYLTLEEIYELLRYKFKSVKNDGKRIMIKTPASLYSWGEKIEITQNDELKNEYTITSQPVLPTTILDYGKNQENILTVKNFLK